MPDRYDALMESAHLIKVDHIAQSPASIGQADDLEWEVGGARESGYSFLFVRDDDETITRWVAVKDLPARPTWPAVDRAAVEIPQSRLVLRDDPLFEILDRLHALRILVVHGRSGVDGVVTAWDVNRRGARLFGFGLCLVVEAELASAIGAHLQAQGHTNVSDLLVALLAEVGADQAADRHQRLAAEDRQLDPLAFASFDDVRRVAQRAGVVDALALSLGRGTESLNQDLCRLRDFRNDVGHEHVQQLSDEVYVLDSLRRADRLARELDGRRDSVGQ